MTLRTGDTVRHKAMETWGTGHIVKIDNNGTAQVSFEQKEEVTIPNAKRFLIELDASGKPVELTRKYFAGTKIKLTCHPEWGMGKIIEDTITTHINVFFENAALKTVSSKNDELEIIKGPAAQNDYLDNLSEDIETIDKQSLPNKEKAFLQRFPGGLKGDLLELKERKYKQEAHEKITSLLSKGEFEQLLKDKNWEELTSRIKICHTLNLLSKFELIRFTNALKTEQGQQAIALGLHTYLHGTGEIQERFLGYSKVLEEFECNTWPLVTLPIFLFSPEKYMFVKPTVTKEAASNRGYDIQYKPNVNWITYRHVQDFSEDLRQRLLLSDDPCLHPRDMIDVQTFMWCTYTKGWSDTEIQKHLDLLKPKAKK